MNEFKPFLFLNTVLSLIAQDGFVLVLHYDKE